MSKLQVLAEPVLVGREKELEQLQQFLNSTIQGKGRTVFVSGEAGSGKTRVAREFLNNARRAGAAVMAGWCLSDSQAPFFPFIEAFNSYYAANTEEQATISFQQPQPNLDVPTQIGLEEREVASWLAGPKPATKTAKAEMLSPQVWKDQALAAVANTVHTIALQAPVILFVEDLHWADSASLALLHYLSRAVKNSERVLLLATFRSEELTADAEGHPHPLAETLRMMRREELFSEIQLSNLDQISVSKLAESMIGSCVQTEFTEKLTVQSGGSPLFIVESLRMLNEHGGLIKDGACVRIDIDKVSIPSKVKDIILRRVGSLRREHRRVLDAASVIGEEFNVEFLSSVVGQDCLEVIETLSAISYSTSLVLDAGDCYKFDHARSREAVYEELSPTLRRGYHRRIAERLEGGKEAVSRLADLAYHYSNAGDMNKAVKFALAAGQDALAKFSNAQAIRHFQYVLQNVSDGNFEERRTALEGLGDAFAASSMYGEAIRSFDQLAASETGLAKLHAIRKASDAAFAKGDVPDLLVEYAKKAQDLAADDRLEMARIIDNRGKAWGWAGRGTPDMDLADYDAALRVFEEENSLADVAEALWRSGVVSSGFIKDLQERGLGELLRSLAIFRELGDVRKQAEISSQTAGGYQVCGLYTEAEQEHFRILKIGEKLGIFSDMWHASSNLTRYFYNQGTLEQSLFYALKGLEYASKTDSKSRQASSYGFLAGLYCQLGDLNLADEYFGKIGELMPPDFLSNNVAFAPVNAGVYFAAKGRWEESEQAFKKALDFYKVTTPGIERFVRRNYAWALDRHGLFEEAKLQRDMIESNLKRQKEKTEAKFGHANLQLSLLTPRKLVVGELVEMRLDLVNVGRKPATLLKVEGVALPELKFSSLLSFCSLQNSSIAIESKSVGPFEVETVKLKFSVAKAGSYALNPEVFYVDDLGCTKTFKLEPITVTVEPAKPSFETLPGRVVAGTDELDKLLLGGIPERYAVVLTAPSSDERNLLIKRFLEAGAEAGEATFYITAEAGNGKALAEKYPLNFFLFVCNPQADAVIRDSPNVFKLKGVENLTEVDIALTKALRKLNPAERGARRICGEILSDVLLQHHAVNTRRWLSALLATLKSKGFTMMAVVDPMVHAPEELQAVLGVFDGEIRVTEKETPEGIRQTLRVRKLVNQKYQETEVLLTKEKLST